MQRLQQQVTEKKARVERRVAIMHGLEIDQEQLPPHQQHVLRTEVAMNQADRMRQRPLDQ